MIIIKYLSSERREYGIRLHAKQRYTALMEKLEEMNKTVDGFASNPKYQPKDCTELLRGK